VETESRPARVRRMVAAVAVQIRAQSRALWDDDPLFVLLGLGAAVLVLIHAAIRWLA